MKTESEQDTATHGSPSDAEAIPALARRAVETFVRERRLAEVQQTPESSDADSLLQQPSACFVTIKTLSGDLRGCIGTIEPDRPTLAEEIVANAISAATRDPRFPPVAADELDGLRYSVDVLMKPEPTRFEDLDPAQYGVIVENETGTRRGLLLPAIAGIETVAQQVQIAARKAGISPADSLRFQRFRVRRFSEPRK
ncbi:MAG TPA: AmmeMemoRadiSam system protein A [Pyrinomonadaceae bacterium]|nr:AmmeMemoRadiSam system protein A [Pyrinomonadaceae bacterium]